jgi:hypothetical protein
MPQIRAILGVLTIATLFGAGTSVVASGQAAGKHETPKAERPLELTQVDVFAKQNWTAEDISILGFYLGMSRTEALDNSRRRGLNLIASTAADSAPCAVSECDLCYEKHLCNGIGLHFGSDDRVEGIYVSRPPQEASPELRRASVTQQCKGQTYLFFQRYSNDLRLKLFGPESGHEGDNPAVRSTTYVYPRMGIKIFVSLSGNKRVTESEADLEVYFVQPKGP